MYSKTLSLLQVRAQHEVNGRTGKHRNCIRIPRNVSSSQAQIFQYCQEGSGSPNSEIYSSFTAEPYPKLPRIEFKIELDLLIVCVLFQASWQAENFAETIDLASPLPTILFSVLSLQYDVVLLRSFFIAGRAATFSYGTPLEWLQT